MTEEKYQHINAAIGFSDLVRTTLGPRGMNKMIVGSEVILTNDGATIVNSLKGGNPIIDLFKSLAKSQELEVGDGTTTAVLLAGQLLSNAMSLVNKGIHPTTIINGYNLANQEAMRHLNESRETINSEDREKIIKTAFGTKLSAHLVNKLTEVLLEVENYDDLKIFLESNSNHELTELFQGHLFKGFTMNERMKKEDEGNIAVMDFPVNLEVDKFSATTAKDLQEVTQVGRDYKKKIVEELVENDVKILFYTDTNPEFESYLTDAGIMGIVVYERENLDGICKATNARASSSIETIKGHLGSGKVRYEKQKIGNQGNVYVHGSGVQTLILHAPTDQTLSEMHRAIDDVVSLLRNPLDMVVGAGAIEIEISNHLTQFAKKVGGKEQLAVEKFAESVEAIPMIIAENAGLDAIEILTTLKTLHSSGQKDLGVDVIQGISDARERGVHEPVMVKVHAISSATNVATLILKLDQILQGDLHETDKGEAR